MEREAIKALMCEMHYVLESINQRALPFDGDDFHEALRLGEAALAQPAHSEWNAALDEAAARIGEIKGFGQATQDSFATYIKGLKK